MITCRELLEFLAEYLDGSLPEPERAVFEEHLRVCPPCVEYLKTYRATIQLGKGACAGERAFPSPIPEELKKAILKARDSQLIQLRDDEIRRADDECKKG